MTERNPEPGGHGEEPEPMLPAEEEAAWAQIVAAYGDQPDDLLGDLPGDAPDDARDDASGGDRAAGDQDEGEAGQPARSFTVYAAGTGPRDWDGPDDPDEDHYVPPEPPPLPEADPTTKFAWLAALGGPLLLLGAVLFDVYMTWWIVTLGVGGFLGGFATLLTRLRDGHDDDFDDPGSGAVV